MKCVICGKEIAKSRYVNAILCSSECFSENYWQERIPESKISPLCVIADGQMYWIGNEKIQSSHEFRGFGGAKWQIDFLDGRQVTSTNLWHNGVIPDKYRAQLPDNAKLRRL